MTIPPVLLKSLVFPKKTEFHYTIARYDEKDGQNYENYYTVVMIR